MSFLWHCLIARRPACSRHAASMLASLLAVALLFCSTASVQADQSPPSPWHFKNVPCVDTTITRVTPRLSSIGQKSFTLEEFEQSGVSVSYDSTLGSNPAAHRLFNAGIMHYQDEVGNDVMINERPGDRVQLCFLGAPAPTDQCNPDLDSRGRSFRVYDYRQRADYTGENSEHTCGGA